MDDVTPEELAAAQARVDADMAEGEYIPKLTALAREHAWDMEKRIEMIEAALDGVMGNLMHTMSAVAGIVQIVEAANEELVGNRAQRRHPSVPGTRRSKSGLLLPS